MNLSVLFATYCAVFAAELIGDKTLYTISTLAVRGRALAMMCGFTVAFMLKMLAAVWVGNAIAGLPRALVAAISAATFFTMALAIWFKKPHPNSFQDERLASWPRGALVAFGAIFLTEWGDIGQITAATLTAYSHKPLAVWLGATAAMMTKGSLAMLLGLSLRDRVPRQVFRYVAVCICVIFGVLSVFRIDL